MAGEYGKKGMRELLKESCKMLQICIRCGEKMYDIACHSKCPNCGYSLDCSDA